LQVIGPTFRSYALPGFDQNIYDPLSNIIAAIRYTVATYGSLPAGMRGVAYGTGGIVGGHGTGDTQPAWLTPGEAVISRAGGYKDRNKAYVDTAAGWFGGKVMYPGDGHLPPHVGATTVNVAAPVVTVNTYLDGAQIASRTELIVDGKFVDFKNDLNRAVGQAVV
jgi:hypothetical protein